MVVEVKLGRQKWRSQAPGLRAQISGEDGRSERIQAAEAPCGGSSVVEATSRGGGGGSAIRQVFPALSRRFPVRSLPFPPLPW